MKSIMGKNLRLFSKKGADCRCSTRCATRTGSSRWRKQATWNKTSSDAVVDSRCLPSKPFSKSPLPVSSRDFKDTGVCFLLPYKISSRSRFKAPPAFLKCAEELSAARTTRLYLGFKFWWQKRFIIPAARLLMCARENEIEVWRHTLCEVHIVAWS